MRGPQAVGLVQADPTLSRGGEPQPYAVRPLRIEFDVNAPIAAHTTGVGDGVRELVSQWQLPLLDQVEFDSSFLLGRECLCVNEEFCQDEIVEVEAFAAGGGVKQRTQGDARPTGIQHGALNRLLDTQNCVLTFVFAAVEEHPRECGAADVGAFGAVRALVEAILLLNPNHLVAVTAFVPDNREGYDHRVRFGSQVEARYTEEAFLEAQVAALGDVGFLLQHQCGSGCCAVGKSVVAVAALIQPGRDGGTVTQAVTGFAVPIAEQAPVRRIQPQAKCARRTRSPAVIYDAAAAA